MKNVIGIDVGGSTTKIVGFAEDGKLIEPIFVKAADPLTSIYGAFGRFTDENGIKISEIKKIMMTGVGSSFLGDNIYGCPCERVSEFECVGIGGLYLSGLPEAVVVSMGTGTAIVYAKSDNTIEYLGGTGVGGGTLMGLSKLIMKMDDIDHITEIAKEGSLSNIDLKVGDITKGDISLPSNLTAANFGKVSDIASKSDMALGIINMIFETAGMMAIFAARTHNIKDIIVTGNMTTIEICKDIYESLSPIFNMNFIIPKYSQFSTVIGAALKGLRG